MVTALKISVKQQKLRKKLLKNMKMIMRVLQVQMKSLQKNKTG